MVIITYEANNLSTRRPIGSTLGKKEEEADKRRSELKTLLSGLEDSDTGTQPKHIKRDGQVFSCAAILRPFPVMIMTTVTATYDDI